MLKVKHERDCDCVVAGFRWHKKGERTLVGSLLLGLFDDAGALQHVGVCASFTQREARRNWWNFSRPIARTRSPITPGRAGRSMDAGGEGGQRMPGGQSRGARARICRGSRCGPNWWWKSLTSTCRAAASVTWRSFDRWRTDKKPSDCTYAQLEVVPPQELDGDFRRRPLSVTPPAYSSFFRVSSCAHSPPFARRIVIRVGSFLRRPQRFGHMTQVHADAGPGG